MQNSLGDPRVPVMNETREMRFLRVCAVTAAMFAGGFLVGISALLGMALASARRPEGGAAILIIMPLAWWIAYKLEGKIVARAVASGRKAVLDQLETAKSLEDIRKVAEGRSFAERLAPKPSAPSDERS